MSGNVDFDIIFSIFFLPSQRLLGYIYQSESIHIMTELQYTSDRLGVPYLQDSPNSFLNENTSNEHGRLYFGRHGSEK